MVKEEGETCCLGSWSDYERAYGFHRLARVH